MRKTFETNAMLVVDPADELVLEGPFNRAVCKKILVFNPNKLSRVSFKLKTTTPRLFFVRPNVGLVKPEERVAIDIFVHPIFPDTNVQRHKFLMQAAECNEPVTDLHEFWRNVQPSRIWDTKIKVKLIDVKEGVQNVSELAADIGNAFGEHQEKDGHDPMAKLLQQVNELEEERQHLVQKVETITKQNEEEKTMCKDLRQNRGSCFFFFLATFFVLIAAIAGGYVGKNFM
ncbi:vesicle-associated membrane protein-associated protein A [Drosophila montana]|uniref:vesicle-associated membrane protein-associated protein A n=1 Tax=Drosophila montana TaxID=40370 RepID=UPI00313DE1ED